MRKFIGKTSAETFYQKRDFSTCVLQRILRNISKQPNYFGIFFSQNPGRLLLNLFLYYVNKLLVEIKYNVNSFLKEINKASFLKTKWHSTLKLKSQFQILDILQGVSSLGVSLIWQVVFKLGYVVFCHSFEFEWTGEKSQATIILGKFSSKP